MVTVEHESSKKPGRHTEHAPRPWAIDRDQAGRIWASQATEPETHSALFHKAPKMAVLTTAGQEFLRAVDRETKRRVLQGAVERQLNGQRLSAVQNEDGRVSIVDDAPFQKKSWWEILRERKRGESSTSTQANIQAVEKLFLKKGALRGWEMAALLDQLHIATEHLSPEVAATTGLACVNTLEPLGGTEQAVFLPYLEGIELDRFWFEMLAKDRQLAEALIPLMNEYSYKVRAALSKVMSGILDQYGFRSFLDPSYRWKFRSGYTHYERYEERGLTLLDVFIDVHPLDENPLDRYCNWMMPTEACLRCRQIITASGDDQSKLELLMRTIQEQAIIFDPLYIRQRGGSTR